MGKSLMQFYADKCNDLLQTRDEDFFLRDNNLNPYLSDFCFELLELSDLVSSYGDDHLINQGGQLFLQEGGCLTADDISKLFIVKQLRK